MSGLRGWPAGTVAVATVGGVEGVRVMLADPNTDGTDRWVSSGWVGETDDDTGNIWHADEDLADLRPLVVLDLADSQGGSLLPDWLRNNVRRVEEGCVSPSSVGKDMRWLADQIEAQSSLKPAEPTGLGAVVEDHEGVRWVRIDSDPELNKPWRRADLPAVQRHWKIVHAVAVLSKGVES